VAFLTVPGTFLLQHVPGFEKPAKRNPGPMKKILTTTLILAALVCFPFTAAAADKAAPTCTRLDEKAAGIKLRYSLDANVDGPVYFDDIRCGVQYRCKELCAMEMISFDTSAAVYDYNTEEKIAIGKAFFWIDENDPAAPILAFSTREAAEKYGAGKPGGIILDYTALADRLLK
jgi:hypothetical protein